MEKSRIRSELQSLPKYAARKFPRNPQMYTPIFSSFQSFKPFTDLPFQFGTFTFEMADKIFREAFSENDKYLPPSSSYNGGQLKLAHTQSSPFPQSEFKGPKNSTLIEEKQIERNGKMILVRKFSVNENGKINKYTHETVMR